MRHALITPNLIFAPRVPRPSTNPRDGESSAEPDKNSIYYLENSGEKERESLRCMFACLQLMLKMKKKKRREKTRDRIASISPLLHYRRTNDLTVTIFYLEYYFLQLWSSVTTVHTHAFPCFSFETRDSAKGKPNGSGVLLFGRRL